MDLVDHWVVGFSGKRRLNNPDAVRLTLGRVLGELRRLSPGQLVGMSSVAIGSDLLFAAEATKAGLPWICILPFPEEDFFNENDFPDANERAFARQRAREAADCEVVRLPRTADELGDSTWRRAAFAEAGFRCVDEADIVITVLDDEADAGKPGGTSDVLAYARAGKRPLVIIDPDTARMRRENWPNRLHDSLTERLRRLPGGKLPEKERAKLPTSTAVQVAEWRSGFARAARKHVPGIRWGTTAVVVLHALATIITASVFLLLGPIDFAEKQPFEKALEVLAFLFVLSGFLFLVWLLWNRPQVKAANYRLAAEIGRSIVATWRIPEAGSQIVRNLPSEFTHFARNLLLHQRLDRRRSQGSTSVSPDNVEMIAANYEKNRIQPQIEYYDGKYKTAQRLARMIEASSLILSLTAVVSAGMLAFYENEETQRATWGFAKLLAATAAPVAVSVLVIHEVKRREARYHEMKEALLQYAEKIGHIHGLAALRDLVVDVERMLLDECYEWWVLAKANVAA